MPLPASGWIFYTFLRLRRLVHRWPPALQNKQLWAKKPCASLFQTFAFARREASCQVAIEAPGKTRFRRLLLRERRQAWLCSTAVTVAHSRFCSDAESAACAPEKRPAVAVGGTAESVVGRALGRARVAESVVADNVVDAVCANCRRRRRHRGRPRCSRSPTRHPR